MSPFDYLNSINFTKKNIMTEEKSYVPFIVNRGLGYFKDTAIIANEMNVNCHLDHKMQYDFLREIVPKKKRFSKWHKAEEDEKIDIIKSYYGYSYSTAKNVADLFDSEAIIELKERLNKGGALKR
tara:strand:+ start:1376 stop:1750 length:375 start_codon:yes stop_codon:yes gene_type:complete